MSNIPNIPDGHKQCIKCSKIKPATNDFFHYHHELVLRNECKPCRSESKKEYYRNNKRRIIEKTRKYARANPEKISAKSKEYYQKNREKILASVRKYRIENIDRIREYKDKNRVRINARARQYYWDHHEKIKVRMRQYHKDNAERKRQNYKEWAQNNKGRIRANVARRRALKVNAKGTYTHDDIVLIYNCQKGRCWWCQGKLGDEYHIDHRIPLSKGGSNDPSNLVVSCPTCNLSKSNKMPWEWNGRLL